MKVSIKEAVPVIGIVLAMLWNIPTLVSTYMDITGRNDAILIYIMMLIIEFSILVFAVRKYEYAAKGFAVIIFLLNLYYYFEGHPFEWTLIYGWYGCFRFTLAIIPAYLIARYSEMFANSFSDTWQEDRQLIDMFRVQIGELTVEIEDNRELIDKYRATFESIAKIRGEKISVSGVKATICECSALIVAGSNKEATQKCSCGKTIDWHGR